jgi:hypothetical protein
MGCLCLEENYETECEYLYLADGLKYDSGGNIAMDASWENAAYLAADLLPIPIPIGVIARTTKVTAKTTDIFVGAANKTLLADIQKRQLVKSFNENSNQWKLVSLKTSGAIGKGFIDKISIYRVYKNVNTCGRIGRHTIVNKRWQTIRGHDHLSFKYLWGINDK